VDDGPRSRALVGPSGLWFKAVAVGSGERPRALDHGSFTGLRFIHPRPGSAQEPCGPLAPDHGLWAAIYGAVRRGGGHGLGHGGVGLGHGFVSEV
jgi:hypothetical protein